MVMVFKANFKLIGLIAKETTLFAGHVVPGSTVSCRGEAHRYSVHLY